MTQIGGVGEGPGEYRLPTALYPFTGDSLLLVDNALRRFLVVSPDGVPTRVFPWFSDGRTALAPRGADRIGAVYFTSASSTEGNAPVDSVPVIVWRSGSSALDTLLMVKDAEQIVARTAEAGSNTQTVSLSFPQPFSPQDDWMVLPDGDLIVARVAPFQLERWTEGQRIVGPEIALAALPITDEDKAPYLRTAFQPAWRWPDFKPAFGSQALVPSDGSLLLLRLNGAVGDSVAYMGFDELLRPSYRIVLASDRRIALVDSRFVFVFRRDSTDLRWLEVYTLAFET